MGLDGCVAVYVCQRKTTVPQENVCSEAEYKMVEAQLNQSYGGASGFGYVRDWNKEYGRNWKDENVCCRWGKKVDNSPANPSCENLQGRGHLTDEQKEDQPEKSKEQFLKKSHFEPVKGGEYDDGVRENYGLHVGQYTDGWANYHGWGKHKVGEHEDPSQPV